jgi:BlaI family transcriptional regulator, penicillinase repressor
MARSNERRPTDAEIEILGVLWNRGPSTVRDVYEELAKTKPIGYTTVLKLMQIMTEKGLVRRDESQRAHVYSAASPREKTERQLLGYLMERVFGGSASRLVMEALSSKKASREDLAEIRKMLDEMEGGPR